MIYLSHLLAFTIGVFTVRVFAHLYFKAALVLKTDVERAHLAQRLIVKIFQSLMPDARLAVSALLVLAVEIARNVLDEKRAEFEERAFLAWKNVEAHEAREREAERKAEREEP